MISHILRNDVVEKYEFDSGDRGTHLVILAGIHGNEVCGPLALNKLMNELRAGHRTITQGRCTIFPKCNPAAAASNSRYIEENLNRVFEIGSSPTSYERRLAAQIAPSLRAADAVLDLHSMQSEGDPFVFLNSPTPESQKLCEALGVTTILRGWPDVYSAYPDLQASCTQAFSDRHGKPNALIECGRHTDPKAADVAYRAAIGALALYGLIEAESKPEAPTKFQHFEMKKLFLRIDPADHFPKVWKNFESYREGELLGTRFDGTQIHADRDGIMVLPSPISALGTEWFYTGHVL